MRVIRRADWQPMPWKNGGGQTSEIAVHPPGAGLDDFDWRISSAIVSQDGPFSRFPGISRTLLLLGGNGMRLEFAGGSVTLATGERHDFDGEAPVTACLLDGPVTDLNLMWRRSRIRAETTLHCLSADAPQVADVPRGAFFCLSGEIRLQSATASAGLRTHDAAITEFSDAGPFRISGAGSVVTVGFTAV